MAEPSVDPSAGDAAMTTATGRNSKSKPSALKSPRALEISIATRPAGAGGARHTTRETTFKVARDTHRVGDSDAFAAEGCSSNATRSSVTRSEPTT